MMTSPVRFRWLCALGVVAQAAVAADGASPAAAASFARDHATWQAARLAALTKADGWLTLVGLHFLKEGANRIGHAADNDIVFPAGPDRLGVVTLAADGKVTFEPALAAGVVVDGQPVTSAELKPAAGTTKPTLASVGPVSFFVIERGGRKALRVKDSQSPRRTQFLGLDYFPVDPAWRIEAQWVPFDPPRQVPITSVLGHVTLEPVPGKAVFARGGRTYELLPIDEGADLPLFFVIADATSGQETYAAARFLYAERPRDGKIVLDFNRAENPPCAFTPFATCPLPPKENRLPFAVTAGEKNYRGGHD